MRLSVIFFHIVLILIVFQTTLTAALSTNGNEVVSTGNGSGEMSLDNGGDSENAIAKPHKEAVSNKKTSNKRKESIRFLTKRKISLIIGIGLSLLIVFGIGAAIPSQRLHDEFDNNKGSILGTNHANAASQSSYLRKKRQEQDKRRRDKEERYTLAQDITRKPVVENCNTFSGKILAGLLRSENDQKDFERILSKLNDNWETQNLFLSEDNIAHKLNKEEIQDLARLLDALDWPLRQYIKGQPQGQGRFQITASYDIRLQKVRNLVENRRLLLARLESSTGIVLAASLENQQEENDFIELLEKMGIDRNKAFKLSSENIAEKLENLADIDCFFLLIDSFEKILKRDEGRDKENHRKRIKSVLESDEWARVKAATNEELSALLKNEEDKIALATVSVACGGKELKDLDVESAVTGLESSDVDFLMRVTKELAQKLEAAALETAAQHKKTEENLTKQLATEKQTSARDAVEDEDEALTCFICSEEYKDLCGENEECMVFSLCGSKNHNMCNTCYCTYKELIEGGQSNDGERLEVPEVIKPCPICQKPTIEESIIYMKFIKATGELM